MGVTHFTQLVAWQLSSELKKEIDVILDRLPAARDRKLCDQVRDAAGSPVRNLAEGFGGYAHKEFAQFARIARGSHAEVQAHLLDAKNRGFVTGPEFERLWRLSESATRATTALLRYLAQTPTIR